MAAAALAATYLLLLIPERTEHETELQSSSARKAFAWNQDAYWKTLEAKYAELRQTGCKGADAEVHAKLKVLRSLLQSLSGKMLGPDAPEFGDLETRMFGIAPMVGACSAGLAEYFELAVDMRRKLKMQSERWDMKDDTARDILYRLLYGSRGALEEIMMQVPAGSFPALVRGTDEPSATPAANVRNVVLHSGDILVSRGGAPTSALIARGNDYPGNFSHVAFVYVDPETREARIIESHIEAGVVISTEEQYLADKKLRVMLLRPRADLSQMKKDPMLPHKAARYAYERALSGHIPYDFEMNYKDHSKLFCSEVPSEAYERLGINLWAGVSHISSPGLRRWLGAFGVRHFETQEPSDLEYDPQLRVVAEWRDMETLKKARLDNAATEVMLEGAEEGEEIGYAWYLLPFSRIVKAYSMLLNEFGKAGPIPEGMSAATALRTENYMRRHEEIGRRLTSKVQTYKKRYGYEPPYWELVKLAREVKNNQF